ncbi:hypothetical protein [Neoroseomonas oryzicola]|uniref:Alpha/beta hydrolase n=1 Tax=Neoroseomonas oryzicola TaxID=535904 RepID=A0A9X9WLP2_9PROT|nr:hypothetical protein [Neoroseomonas oryzicola]MBR0661252.1 hypothetical protein [Neoroseomonas oryzicola]NKE16550.1 hypothetical protein [Neoroseomonas oryzicola]
MRKALIATALLASLARPAAADEYTTYASLLVTPTGASHATRCDMMSLLNLPAAWHSGDAIVVMLTAGPAYAQQRDSLIAELLAEQAAVLEVSPSASPTCVGGGHVATPPVTQAAALDMVFGGLRAARQTAGGGLVVAIGLGPEGSLALAAADEAEAGARLGPDGPRFAAGLAIGDGSARLRLGAAQVAPERAEARLGLLCEALVHSGTTKGAANGQACATELEAGMVSVRAALQR